MKIAGHFSAQIYSQSPDRRRAVSSVRYSREAENLFHPA
jgi:hypothetical protein